MRIEFRQRDVLPDTRFVLVITRTWAKPGYPYRAQLTARGGDLGALQASLRVWARRRRLRPTVLLRNGSVVLDLFVKDWPRALAFVLYWVGEDIAERALRSSAEADDLLGAELRMLRRELAAVSSQIAELKAAS